MIKIFLTLLIITATTAFAYEVEKEGDWWYLYKGNDIVGAYSKSSYSSDYRIGCGNPRLPVSENKYFDPTNFNSFKDFSTKRAAKNAIIQYCKKR